MSARYLTIDAMQEPYDLGLDEQGRSRIQFNINATKTASVGTLFEQELASILAAAVPSLVLAGAARNVFIGSTARLPNGGGPYVTIISTSGLEPIKQHNQPGGSFLRPTALIVVRATDQVAAIAIARAAYDALTVVVNQTVTP